MTVTVTTTYIVSDARGVSWPVSKPERAERLSRAGFTVTAATRRAER